MLYEPARSTSDDIMASIDTIREQFPVTRECIFFNHAAAGPIPVRAQQAMAALARDHAEFSLLHMSHWQERYAEIRAQAARLVCGKTEGIAFIQNTSHGISIAANGIEWQPGDNVVLPEMEFPSNFYPWMNLTHLGVEARLVPAPDGVASIDEIAAHIDPRTRAVAVSFVQYSNGFRYDLAKIGALCRDRGPLLVVDGTQGVGALCLDVEACAVDVLAVSAHKWLLGPLGIGLLHCSARAMERLRVPTVGWLSVPEPYHFTYQLEFPPDACRFEPGTENAAGIYGLGGTLDLIEELGPAWIEARVLSLTQHLCEGLARKGYRVLSPRGDGASSGIIVFDSERQASAELHQRLSDANVLCSLRGGGVRFSPHYYNTEAEVDAALELL